MKPQIIGNPEYVRRTLMVNNDATLKGAKLYDPGQNRSLVGATGVNYSSESDLKPAKDFTEVVLDPSLSLFADKEGITIDEALERLDPITNYDVSSPLFKFSAMDRQLMRYGYMKFDGNLDDRHPMNLHIAHTPASEILFPAYMNKLLFWDPQKDLDLDPSLLFSGRRIQKEETFKQIKILDSQFKHARMFKISEGGEVPVSTISHEGYSGSMSKHGVGLCWTLEFARRVSLKLFDTAQARARLRERRAFFDHIVTSLRNGDATYGMGSSVTTSTCASFDPIGCTGDGDISYYALSKFLYGLRPYNMVWSICNVDTYHKFISATPPSNVVDTEILRQLSRAGYPGMPESPNKDFFGKVPPCIVVPAATLPDNYIMFIDTKNAIEHVVMANGEINELGYNMDNQTYKQIYTIQDGIGALPGMYDACQILRMEID